MRAGPLPCLRRVELRNEVGAQDGRSLVVGHPLEAGPQPERLTERTRIGAGPQSLQHPLRVRRLVRVVHVVEAHGPRDDVPVLVPFQYARRSASLGSGGSSSKKNVIFDASRSRTLPSRSWWPRAMASRTEDLLVHEPAHDLVPLLGRQRTTQHLLLRLGRRVDPCLRDVDLVGLRRSDRPV